MVVTRSKSGATKKADTKVAVNRKVAERASKKATSERASKKTIAGGERARRKLTTLEKVSRLARKKEKQLKPREKLLMREAWDIFMIETFLPQYNDKYPDVSRDFDAKLVLGQVEWDSMTDSEKAPYAAAAEKKWADINARAKEIRKNITKSSCSLGLAVPV